MSSLYLLRASTLGVLCVALFLVSAGQTIHACFMATRRQRGSSVLSLCLEAAIVVHLVLGCAAANSAMENHGDIFLLVYPLLLHVKSLLWVNAAAAALACAVGWKERRVLALTDAVVLAACTPPAIDALGTAANVLFVIDASYFTARTAALLVFDARTSTTMVSRLSIVDALDAMPEGVLWIGPGGGVMFMNDAMRATLTSLGFATDLADARELWDRLARRAEGGRGR
jgi:PAS domain-containing protein